MADSEPSGWRGLRGRLKGPTVQARAVDANDGIIATAGLLEGFAGAGADDQLLITAALAATIAGALSVGGAIGRRWLAERDAQLATIAHEHQLLAAHPDDGLAELIEHYTARGLAPDLARDVAEQLHAADPLETEYGTDEMTPAHAPVLTGLAAGLSFAVGSSIPLLTTVVAPISLDAIAALITVVVSLIITSTIAARSAYLSARRTIIRSLIVGLSTLGVSNVAGLVLLPPAGRATIHGVSPIRAAG